MDSSPPHDTWVHECSDGGRIAVRRWLPDTPARAVVQIVHGMAEHGGRYARFAGRLLADAYRAAGLPGLSLQIYPEGRHEMLNESNREEVMSDVIAWFDKVLEGAA